MKFCCFHPSVAPFVQQAALGLAEAGLLDSFVTTLAWHGDNLPKFLAQKLSNRCVINIPESRLRRFPSGEILRLIVGKLDRAGIATDTVWEWSEHRFDRKVARTLHSGLTGVYGFEHACLASFQRAKELGIQTIYDVPAPETTRIRSLMAQAMEQFPHLRSEWFEVTSRKEPRRLERRKAEWELADRVICASEFTRSTFEDAGYDVGKVRVVPYGCPDPIPEEAAINGGSPPSAPLRLLWAGTFTIRKGAHILLDTWREWNPGPGVRLDIYGRNLLPEECLTTLPGEIRFHAPVSRPELLRTMQTSDLLVFPTLYDGFGMVVTEALSRGLPVLTTRCAGASTFIRDRENGLLIQENSVAALHEALQWCADHRESLPSMRIEALRSAASWQWHHYRESLRQSFLSLSTG